MSAETHAHGHGHDHGHHGDAPAHATRKGYLIGFLLSVVLTAIPFWLVMSGALHNPTATAFVILAFAAVQMVVHMIFFLHLSPHSEHGWTLVALVFTLVVVAITLIGSIWVMYHMNANMMPGMSGEQSGM
jgi:cytochrome o ubiquinol oxidase operon protein cyoD